MSRLVAYEVAPAQAPSLPEQAAPSEILPAEFLFQRRDDGDASLGRPAPGQSAAAASSWQTVPVTVVDGESPTVITTPLKAPQHSTALVTPEKIEYFL